MRLENKVVVLTGAAQGIGAAIARLFSAEGAVLALIDRQEDQLKTLTEELSKNNDKVSFYTFDITNKEPNLVLLMHAHHK